MRKKEISEKQDKRKMEAAAEIPRTEAAHPNADEGTVPSKRNLQKAYPQGYQAAQRPEEDVAYTEGGFMMTTAEIMDFLQGADS